MDDLRLIMHKDTDGNVISELHAAPRTLHTTVT